MSIVRGTLRRRVHALLGQGRRTGATYASARNMRVFQEAEQANIVTAGYARFGVSALLAGIVLTLGPGLGAYRFGEDVLIANLVLSSLGVVLVRRRRSRGWIPYLLALTDAVFLLGITAFYDRFPGNLPGQVRPAIIAVWGFFLALALSTVRGRPAMLAAQTALFAGGFLLVTDREPALALDDPGIAHSLAVLFGPGYNAIRSLLILLTGAVLVVASIRARSNLWNAIEASGRAADLGRYFAPTVTKIIADTEIAALRQGRQQEMAVLFADIRGFTSLSETLKPREIASFLNEFRQIATNAIEGEGGVVDKFIGDAVMGLFGLPCATQNDAEHAVRASLRLLASVERWNVERENLGRPNVRIGVGIHYGPVFVGALGVDRLEFTVLGDTVNVASRLEGLTKTLDSDVVASGHILAAAGLDTPDRAWAPLPAQTIRGHREAVDVWALKGPEGDGLDAYSDDAQATASPTPPRSRRQRRRPGLG